MTTDLSEDYYRLALSMVPGIGPKASEELIKIFTSAAEVFLASKKDLCSVSGITATKVAALHQKNIMLAADAELLYLQKHDIHILYPGKEAYPERLLHCVDAPSVLFYKGVADLNATKMVAVIGTRKLSDYGQQMTEELIDGLATLEGITVVSGLAQGIDAVAHRRSLKKNIPTVGVLGHGLGTMYPAAHRSLAKDMLQHGGLLTEFVHDETPIKTNFPVRNRVVAGMSDCTIVVESGDKGGAMITAYIADSYNREVMAYPGRTIDSRSAGTNHLIKKNVARLVTSAGDVMEAMNWLEEAPKKAQPKQLQLLLSPAAQQIWDQLNGKEHLHVDDLASITKLDYGTLATTLLEMEMDSLLKSLPGKRYRLK